MKIKYINFISRILFFLLIIINSQQFLIAAISDKVQSDKAQKELFNFVKNISNKDLSEESADDQIKKLVEIGADVNAKDSDDISGKTPLQYATINNLTNIVKALLANKAFVFDVVYTRDGIVFNRVVDEFNNTLLHMAVKIGNIDIINMFLNYSYRDEKYLFVENQENKTALDLALQKLNGDISPANKKKYNDIVLLLAEREAKDLIRMDVYALSHIMSVSPYNKNNVEYQKMFSVLKQKEFDAKNFDKNVIASLIENSGISIFNSSNKSDDSTPLILAIRNDLIYIATMLINNKVVDVNVKSFLGNLPLQEAIKYGRVDIIPLLIEKGANLDTFNASGKNPIHEVLESNVESTKKIEILKLLIKALIEKNIEEPGFLAKVINAKNNNIKATASVGAYDAYGNPVGGVAISNKYLGATPLHEAVINGNVDAVKILLDAGADIGATNNDERTPLNIAELFYKNDIIIRLLKDAAKKAEETAVRRLEQEQKEKEEATAKEEKRIKEEEAIAKEKWEKEAALKAREMQQEQTPTVIADDEDDDVSLMLKNARAQNSKLLEEKNKQNIKNNLQNLFFFTKTLQTKIK